MPDTGTGTDPSTDRCWSCGHLDGADCGCSCCCSGSDEERDAASEARYEQVYQPAVTDPAYVNERATAKWISILLGRGSGAEIGSTYPGRLWVSEVIDHSRAEAIELGERAWQWTDRPWPIFRERVS